jgi:hypothetical protein
VRSVKDVTVLWGVRALPSTVSDLNKDAGGYAGATASAKLHFIRSTQSVEVSRFNCASKGIVAESSEVLICKERGSFSEVLVIVSPAGLGIVSLIVLGANRSCANASL